MTAAAAELEELEYYVEGTPAEPLKVRSLTLAEQAVASVEALIREELEKPDAGRFNRIKDLCRHAYAFAVMGARRLADIRACSVIDVNENEDGADEDAGAAGYPLMRAMPARRIDDTTAFMRELMMMLKEQQDLAHRDRSQKSATQARRDFAEEATALMDLRMRMHEYGRPTEVVDRQIDAALAALESNDAVVSPDVVR